MTEEACPSGVLPGGAGDEEQPKAWQALAIPPSAAGIPAKLDPPTAGAWGVSPPASL